MKLNGGQHQRGGLSYTSTSRRLRRPVFGGTRRTAKKSVNKMKRDNFMNYCMSINKKNTTTYVKSTSKSKNSIKYT